MRRFLIFALVIGSYAAPALAGEAQALYVSVLPDIPVMAGLHEDMAHSVDFDKESGRVVEAVLLGDHIAEKRVVNFYQEALSQLGWKPIKTGVFVRNGEQLLVESRKVGDGVVLNLSLVPKTD